VDEAARILPADLVGMIVTSRAGRDAGDRYVVMAVAGRDMVLVANGERRGNERPKKKNVKHLAVHGPAGAIGSRLREGGSVSDEELRQALAGFQEGG
jgi:hypothetical protein